MALGDGTNWDGTATASMLLGIMVDFDPPSEAAFQVRNGDHGLDVAIALTIAWNTLYPGEATMRDPVLPLVKFTRSGRTVVEIYLRRANVKLEALGTTGTNVNGLTVTQVST